MHLSVMIDIIVTTGLQPDPGDVGVGRTHRVTGHIKEFRRREKLGCFFTWSEQNIVYN